MMGRRRSRGEAEPGADGASPVAAAGPVGGMVDRVAQFGRRGRSAPGEADSLEDWVELPSYRPSFGALLVRAGLTSDRDVKSALEEGLRTGERLGEVVIRRGWATEERIAQLLAEQWQLSFRDAESVAVDPTALQRVPLAVARELRALPIGFENGVVVLAIADPNDELFAAVRSQVGEATYVVVARSVLDPLIESPSSRYALEVGDDHAQVEDPIQVEEPTPFERVEPGDVVRDLEWARSETPHEASWPLTLVAETDPPSPERPSDDPFAPIEPASIAADYYEPVDDAVPTPAPIEEQLRPAFDTVVSTPVGGNVGAVIDSIDAAAAELVRARSEVEALGSSLSATHAQLADSEAALAAAAEARERDQETIRRLEAELAQRADVFQALKSQIATLTRTLDAGDGES